MAKPSLGAPAPAPFFTPASDQTTVSHLKVTVQFATPKPDGRLQLTVFSGNVCFGVVIDDLPGRPEYKLGDRLILEYPKGQNPMTAHYSAIYHADQVSQVTQPQLLNRSTTVSEKTAIIIADQSLSLMEHLGHRVVTLGMVDKVHGRPEGTTRRNFNTNKDKLVEGEDYFKVCADEFRTHNAGVISNKSHEDVTLLTESGYLMVVKSFTDDLAWKVQRQLVNCYFRKNEPVQGSSETLPHSILDQVGTVIQQQLAAMFQAELPRLVQGELAKQQMAVRCGVTAGQVWQLYKLDQLKNGPQKLSRLLTAFGCEIDGGGKSEQGGRTAKMFDPDKSDKAMKSGLLEHCQRYIRERTGQRQLFAVQQDK